MLSQPHLAPVRRERGTRFQECYPIFLIFVVWNSHQEAFRCTRITSIAKETAVLLKD